MLRSFVYGAVACCVFVTAANASPGYTANSPIQVMNTRETAVDIYAPQAADPMACGAVGWFRINTSASNFQAIYASLLTRQAQGKAVKLFVSSCDSDGTPLFVAVGAE